MSRRVASLAGLAGLVVLAPLLAACTASPSSAPPVDDPTGTWGASTTEGQAYLDLAADGTASGSDGCNRVSGSWKVSETGVSFSAWATTRMYCPEVDAWLSTSVAGLVSDDHLTLIDQYNVPVGSLQRTSS